MHITSSVGAIDIITKGFNPLGLKMPPFVGSRRGKFDRSLDSFAGDMEQGGSGK